MMADAVLTEQSIMIKGTISINFTPSCVLVINVDTPEDGF